MARSPAGALIVVSQLSNETPTVSNLSDTGPAVVTDPATYRRSFIILFLSLIGLGMGQSLVFAVLPPAGRELGFTELQVGTIFTISAVLWMLGAPFWGNRSDEVGRRPLILLGLTAFAVSMGGFAFVLHLGLSGYLALLPTFIMLVITRSIFGGFGSAGVPSALAYIADRTALHERASQMSALTAAFALGIITGPVVVAVMLPWGLVAPFFAVACIGGFGALAVAFLLPDVPPPKPQEGDEARARVKVSDARVWPFLVVAVVMEVGQAIAMQVGGFYAMDALGLSPTEGAQAVGVALMGTAGAVLFVQLIVIRVLEPSPRAIIVAGTVFGIAGFTTILTITSYPAFFVGMTLLGFFNGLMRPGVISAASISVTAEEQGGVAGLMNATGGFGVVVAPFVGMPLYGVLPQAPYLLCLVSTVALFLFVLFNRRIRSASGRNMV